MGRNKQRVASRRHQSKKASARFAQQHGSAMQLIATEQAILRSEAQRAQDARQSEARREREARDKERAFFNSVLASLRSTQEAARETATLATRFEGIDPDQLSLCAAVDRHELVATLEPWLQASHPLFGEHNALCLQAFLDGAAEREAARKEARAKKMHAAWMAAVPSRFTLASKGLLLTTHSSVPVCRECSERGDRTWGDIAASAAQRAEVDAEVSAFNLRVLRAAAVPPSPTERDYRALVMHLLPDIQFDPAGKLDLRPGLHPTTPIGSCNLLDQFVPITLTWTELPGVGHLGTVHALSADVARDLVKALGLWAAQDKRKFSVAKDGLTPKLVLLPDGVKHFIGAKGRAIKKLQHELGITVKVVPIRGSILREHTIRTLPTWERLAEEAKDTIISMIDEANHSAFPACLCYNEDLDWIV